MPAPETGLGLQNVLMAGVAAAQPMSFAETPSGLLLAANGLDPMLKWDGLSGSADTAGVRPPASPIFLIASGVGTITGRYVAFHRYLDKDGNPSNLSPVSGEIDCGTDGFVEDLAFNTGNGQVTIRSTAHGLTTGVSVVLAGVEGLTLANGVWTVTVVDADHFRLDSLSITTGTYTQGGTWSAGAEMVVFGELEPPTETKVVRRQILRNLAGNADVFYVDVDTADLDATAFASTRSDEELATQEPVPLTYGDDDLPFANRYGLPPSAKAYIASHQGRIFAGGDVTYNAGHAEPAFNSATVRGVGTDWRPSFVGRFLYLQGATKPYEIAAVDADAQTITLTEPYFEAPVKFARYAIRSPVGERKLVYFTEPGLPEAWPPYNALALPEDSDEVSGLVVLNQFLYVLEHRHIYRVTFQDDPADDGYLFLATHRGCVNHRCWAIVDGTVYLLDEAGIHKFDGQDSQPVSQAVQNIFQVDDTGELQIDWTADTRLWHAAFDAVRTTIRWFLTIVGFEPLTHAIALNYRTGRFWIEQYPTPMTASCTATLGYRRSLAGTTGRRVVCLAEGSLDGVADLGTLHGTATSANATHLVDSTASFHAIEGVPVAIVAGTGKGQQRTIAGNTATSFEVVEPWDVTPDRTSEYQVGGIPWSWRSGWFRLSETEEDTPRDVELIYQPLTHRALVSLQLFFDMEATPRHWSINRTQDGITITKGGPEILIRLDTQKGYVIQRLGSHSDPYAMGEQFVSVALAGVQGQEPVRMHQIVLSGASTRQ